MSFAQFVLEQPDSQPHRADLSKMPVHRRARQRGPGAARMPEGGLAPTTVFYKRFTADDRMKP